MAAAGRDRAEFARMLLQYGAEPQLLDQGGRPAWQFTSDAELRVLLGGPSAELCDAVISGDLEKALDTT